MAADYKTLLIKYVDKIVFVAFLVLFGWQAFKFITTTTPPGDPIPRMKNGNFPEQPALSKERFVLKSFTAPLEPDATHDLTSDPEKVEPGPNEKQCPLCGWIAPRTEAFCPRCKYSYTGVPPPVVDNTTEAGPKIEGIPFRVLSAGPSPVDLFFKGFYKRPGGVYVLQINWATNTRTNFVKDGELFQEYKIFDVKVEKKTVRKAGIPPYTADVRTVAMQKQDGPVRRVEEGQTITESVPVASLQVLAGRWRVEHEDKTVSTGAQTFDVYAEDVLINLDDQTITFKVFKVTVTQVILVDRDGKQHELPAAAK